MIKSHIHDVFQLCIFALCVLGRLFDYELISGNCSLCLTAFIFIWSLYRGRKTMAQGYGSHLTCKFLETLEAFDFLVNRCSEVCPGLMEGFL